MNYQPKPLFLERISKLLKDKQDISDFLDYLKTKPPKSIRVNTLKISPTELIKKLPKSWKLNQPYKNHPEIVIIKNQLKPGELGNSINHLIGNYYIQEISSMMSIIALFQQNNLSNSSRTKRAQEKSKLNDLTITNTSNDTFLDLCAAPGSKTTQAAQLMENKGLIIANDELKGRTPILSLNIKRLGITNTIVTRENGIKLCEKIEKLNIHPTKILLDPSCSGEGTIRTCPENLLEWSESNIKQLTKTQKKLASAAINLLPKNGELLYSTCTHAPEENELIIQHLLDNFKDKIKIEKIDLPLITRPGITEWQDKKLAPQLKNCIRIYQHDNNTEGFFLCKIKKLK